MKLENILTEAKRRLISDEKFAELLKKQKWVSDFAKDEKGKDNYDAPMVYSALGDHDVIWVRDNAVIMSAEDPATASLVDYYGEFKGGYPYIDQKVEDFAEKYGRSIEWESPGAIGFYKDPWG